MKTWGVGVIGCGAVSRMHLEAIKGLDNARLIAVCDNKPDVAKAAGEKYGCPSYTDYHDLLALPEIEIVHIATPHHQHVPIAIDALKAGKKVLTEKPIAHDLDEAKKLLDFARDKDLAVCFQNRYNESSQLAKKIIDNGEYGKVKAIRGYVAWHREAPYYTNSDWRGKMATEGGGVLINQAIHTLDLLLWYGGKVKSVKGSVSTDSLAGIIDVEDSAHFVLNYESGVRGTFYATTAHGSDSPIVVEVTLENATLELHADSLFLIKDGERKELVDHMASIKGAKGYWGTGHATLIKNLYDAFEKGEHFWIDAQVGYDALQVLKGVYRSSEENTLVEF